MNEITAVQGEGAFELHQSILSLKKQMGLSFVELGRLLKKIRDYGYFQVLGYDTFSSYVINSELGFSRRTAFYYIEIYEWYVDKLAYTAESLAELGYDKLLKLLPMVKDGAEREKVDDLMNEVQELRPVDFEKKYKDEQKQDGHETYLAPPEYFRCECHGKWHIVIPIEDCCPKWLEEVKKWTKNTPEG
jgi:hypothetical protein